LSTFLLATFLIHPTSPPPGPIMSEGGISVLFRIQSAAPAGYSCHLVGGPSALGTWDLERAVPLAADPAAPVAAADIPIPPTYTSKPVQIIGPVESFEYKYVMIKADDPDTKIWTPSRGNLVFDVSHRNVKKSDGTTGLYEVDDTMRNVVFRCKASTTPGQSIGILGSVPELGAWDKARAYRLQFSSTFHEWTAKIPLRASTGAFEFKYVTLAGSEITTFEDRQNRSIASLDDLLPWFDPETGVAHVDLSALWGNRNVLRLLIFHPLPEPYTLCAIGGGEALGNWWNPANMVLGNPRRLLTSATGRCWELEMVAPEQADVGGADAMQYRYLRLDQNAGKAVWEREPNRRVPLPVRGLTDAAGLVEVFDGNFVDPTMEFDNMEAPGGALAIGPYPQSEEDVEALLKGGIRGVLNVQTDHDMAQRRVDWPLVQSAYHKHGIAFERVEITDFSGDDLVVRLGEAVRALRRLVEKASGGRVFVHCTAGMGRAPAVVVGYLARYEGMGPDDALALVKRCRPKVGPNMGAIKKALQNGI